MFMKYRKPLALLLSAVLMAGGCLGISATAKNTEKVREPESVTTAAKTGSENAQKDETVYVLAGADGSVDKIIVSDWIKNPSHEADLSDRSELTDIENVKGDETYVMDRDNALLWDAQGNDIYYQGTTDKELPVSLRVSYWLDGVSVSPEELAGQSGTVTIRYDYTNHEQRTVTVNGKEETVCVPFAMLTGMMLDNDVFRNVTVSNGKLINDGDHTVVVGIAFPGLQDSLQLDQELLELPDYVEITAEVTDFALTNTVTLATNEVFNGIQNTVDDVQDGEDLEEKLTSSLDTLRDALSQLMDGSSQLYDGLCTLLEKSNELVAGIEKLAQGAQQLKSGAATLGSGASSLASGAADLSSGLNTLNAKSSELNAGAAQVFNSLLSMANSQLAEAGLTVPTLTIGNYADTLNALIASLDPTNVAAQAQATARDQVTSAVNAKRDEITAAVTAEVEKAVTAQVTEVVRSNVLTQVLAAMGMTKEQYDAAVAAGALTEEQLAAINAAVDTQMASQTVQDTITANVAAQMSSETIQATIASKTDEQIALLIEQNMNSPEVQAKITAALEQAASGAASISALKEQLDAYATFYYGLNQYTQGVASAKNGADQLSAGASSLNAGSKTLVSGVNELCDGILTLKNGAPALVDGVKQLRDGAMQLSDGLTQFNEEGVQKILDAVDGNLAGLYARIRAMADVSRDYRAFAGISDDMDGQVKFIYRTDAIEDAE